MILNNNFIRKFTILVCMMALVFFDYSWHEIHAEASHQIHSKTRPSILFIGADDLRTNIGFYGDENAITPNLDQLARESVVFTKAYVQFASCNASRASMLTGMRPDSLKVWKLNTHFRKNNPEVITLPQHFKNNGYHTESIGKIFHNYANITDNVSWSVPARYDQESHFQDYVSNSSIKSGAKRGLATESAVYQGNQYIDDKITQDAITTIKRLKSSNKPFFLGVGFMKPHSPFNAPSRFWDLYPGSLKINAESNSKPDYVPAQNWFYFKELREFKDIPKTGSMSSSLSERLLQGYYAATSYLDNNVGKIIEALKTNGLYENTIIVFWSDHGYHLGENGHWTKATLRELDTRVPLMFRIPNQRAFKADNITEYIDIYPTLAELSGLAVPESIDGKSFNKIFTETDYQHKSLALSQVSRPWPGNKIESMGYAIRTEQFRFVRWLDIKGKTISDEEYYDTKSDPLERKNILSTLDEKDLKKLRELWREATLITH